MTIHESHNQPVDWKKGELNPFKKKGKQSVKQISEQRIVDISSSAKKEWIKTTPQKNEKIKAQPLQNRGKVQSTTNPTPDSPTSPARPKFPVSEQNLKQQLDLFFAERKVKTAVAKKGEDLSPMVDSVNEVFPLSSKGISEPAEAEVFFKTGEGTGIQPTVVLEKIVWDLAEICGMQDTFTPTKLSSLATTAKPDKTKGDLEVKSKFMTETGEIAQVTSTQEPKRGATQLTQPGQKLSDFIKLHDKDLEEPIEMNKLLLGAMRGICMGLYDAHAENIIIAPDGSIKYFDNARCLPPKNGIIRYEDHFNLCTMRSGLLGLKIALKPIDTETKNMMRQEIQAEEKMLSKVESYLNSPLVKLQIAKLPPGWFDTKASLAAMRERIDAMKHAIDDPHVKTLVDFCFATTPEFKVYAALGLGSLANDHLENINKLSSQDSGILNLDKSPSEVLRLLNTKLGTTQAINIDEMAEKCAENSLNPKWIKIMCDDPDRSFPQIITAMQQRYAEVQEKPASPYQKEEYRIHASEVTRPYLSEMTVEMKDTRREDAYIKPFLNAGLKMYTADEKLANYVASQPVGTIIAGIRNLDNPPPKIFLYTESASGLKIYNVVFTPEYGKIYLIDSKTRQKLNKQPMTVENAMRTYF